MLNGPPIRALVVDDSILTRRVISTALASVPDITVVGTASNGTECLAAVEELQPDVITLDVEMPGLNGLHVLQRLMARRPIPVIMVSYLTKAGADITVRAMLAGAVDFVAKPGGPIVRDLAGLRDELIRKVRAAARSRPRITRPAALARPLPPTRPSPPAPPRLVAHPRGSERFQRLVVIGSSTGGPQALRVVLADLTPDPATAYLLVQHMPPGMTSVLADLLNETSTLTVREARDDDRLEPSTALIAPGDFHVRLGPGGTIHLDQGPKVHWVRPSVDVALLSAAELYGDRTVAAILTGIGVDGADGAVAIHAAGGTMIAEDESTAVVYGMPKAVAQRGVASAIVPLHDMARTITSHLATLGRSRERLRV
jgi:two-component system chemotaxis response regulator CheB